MTNALDKKRNNSNILYWNIAVKRQITNEVAISSGGPSIRDVRKRLERRLGKILMLHVVVKNTKRGGRGSKSPQKPQT